MKVEQQLAADEGLSRYDVGREALLEKIHAWRDKYGDAIYHQLRKLGSQVTIGAVPVLPIDEGYVEAVLQAFERFGDQGWIYRGRRMINWCPECRTVISDRKTEERDLDGHLWHIRYPGLDGGQTLLSQPRVRRRCWVIPGCVHPSDKRWSEAVGQRVVVPLVDRAIPHCPR